MIAFNEFNTLVQDNILSREEANWVRLNIEWGLSLDWETKGSCGIENAS